MKDKIGQKLVLGDYVVCDGPEEMEIGRIDRSSERDGIILVNFAPDRQRFWVRSTNALKFTEQMKCALLENPELFI